MKKLLLIPILILNITAYSQVISSSNRNAIDVNVQDQTSDIVDVFICSLINNVTLAEQTALDSVNVVLESGHGAVAGNILCLKHANKFYQAIVLSVDVDTLTVDSPLDYAFPVASIAHVSSNNLAVDGSSTPVVFRVIPPPEADWDIVRVMGVMTDDLSMDDGKFGGGTALTNGIVFRVKDGYYKNIFNIKKNGDFRLRAYDLTYVDATLGPAGLESLGFRRTFGGQSKNGVVIRLCGKTLDEFQIIVRDDLTFLPDFKVVIQGHVVIN